MNNQKQEIKKKSLPRLELSNKPKLILTEKLQKQIDFLHQKVGKSEWSGELITREEGAITDLDNWRIIAEDIFLADVGSPGFTGYEVDKGGFKAADIVQMYEDFPGLLEGTQKNHHIHTHHNMSAFFSGTDWENLNDRSDSSNYFLMLIVNFDGKYIAKVAFKGKRKTSGGDILEFANNQDNIPALTMSASREEEVLVVMDCELIYEVVKKEAIIDADLGLQLIQLASQDVALEDDIKRLIDNLQQAASNILADEPFQERYERVVKAIEEEKAKVKYLPSSGSSYGSYGGYGGSVQGRMFQDGYDSDYYNDYSFDRDDWEFVQGEGWLHKSDTRKNKGKKIGEMTDKEFNKWEQGEMGIKEWDLRHARILINACITDTTTSQDATHPTQALERLNKKLRGKRRQDWLEAFTFNLLNYPLTLWENITPADNISIYNEVVKCLSPYKSTPLISSVIDIAEDCLTDALEESDCNY